MEREELRIREFRGKEQNGHEESQMEGEGNYFKACILERVAFGGGCQFEKWRLCNSQHNPIDGFHSSMSRVETMVICRSLRSYALFRMSTDYASSTPYGVLWCFYHSASVRQCCTQLILLNFPRIACTSKSLPKSPGQRSKVQFTPR